MLLHEFKAAPIGETDLFLQLMEENALISVFESKFANSKSKGVDRLNGFQFANRAPEHLGIAAQKCIDGTYRFTPYLEHLKLKGRAKEPRIIGIPCVRDRVILHQLNVFLAQVFPECVPKNIANSHIRNISTDLTLCSSDVTYVCGCDIRTFYDSIRRDLLIKEVAKRVKTQKALDLIRHAIHTPIVPKNVRRCSYKDFKIDLGVPQGLAISNILSAIYLRGVDDGMSKLDIKYYRYVDDILMYGDESEISKAQKSLNARLSRRGLILHGKSSGKSHFAPLNKPFSYLGYRFEWPNITVRDSTIERLLQSLAAKFSDYIHNRTHRLEKFRYLDEKRIAEIFIHELNEKVTGAISEKRRYGWVAYFSQINDMTLLYKLDSMLISMFHRLPDFEYKNPPSLKKFVRAHFEMKFNPTGGYVKNYDVITTRVEKLSFLVERGQVGPEDALTDDQIDDRFERYRKRILSEMHADEGVLY